MITIESIFTKENMIKAARKVARKSSAGIDGISAKEIVTIIEKDYTYIYKRLINAQYHPKEVRMINIPKSNNQFRHIGIATALDRCIQGTMNMCLYPIFEPEWSEHSFGFRKSKSCKMAINKVIEYIQDDYKWAIKLDLSGCFDNINQNKVLFRIRKKIEDERVIDLVKDYLRIIYVDGNNKWANDKGTPQGSPLSPLFAEIIMMDIDREFQKRGIKFVRYADDILILTKSQSSAQRVKDNSIRCIQKKCHLIINHEKSCIKSLEEGINFLGFCIYTNGSQIHITPNLNSIRSLKYKIRMECNERKPDEIPRRINEITRGWLDYYIESECRTCCRRMDLFIKKQIHKAEKRYDTVIDNERFIGMARLYENKRHLLNTKKEADGQHKKTTKTMKENCAAANHWCRDPPAMGELFIL